MVCVYKIDYSPEAPTLEILDSKKADLLVFDGRQKSPGWPRGGLEVKAAHMPKNLFRFYRLALGALVYREDLIAKCDDFYWIATQNVEPLQARSNDILFNIINVVDFMEPLRPGEPGYEAAAPRNVCSFYAPIFKISGRPTTDLYCVSGLTNPMNEFKSVYDHYGFKGLEFSEVWRGEP